MFKVNTKDTRTTLLSRSGVLDAKFEQVPHLVLMFQLLALNNIYIKWT